MTFKKVLFEVIFLNDFQIRKPRMTFKKVLLEVVFLNDFQKGVNQFRYIKQLIGAKVK